MLIIFDNSASMGNYVYDVDESYSPGAGGGALEPKKEFIYFTKGAPDSDNMPVPGKQDKT